MSQFMPEKTFQQQSVDSLAQTGQGAVSESNLSLIEKVLAKPEVISQVAPNFFAYMVDYLAVNQPFIPISQISGFSQFTAQYATVSTEQAITSSTYGNLGTTGPQITGLPDGKYLFIYGAALEGRPTDNATIAWMSVSFNGAAASDNDGIRQQGELAIPASRATVATLQNNGNNTVTAKYRWESSGTPASNPTASYRWLVALKYANA